MAADGLASDGLAPEGLAPDRMPINRPGNHPVATDLAGEKRPGGAMPYMASPWSIPEPVEPGVLTECSGAGP